MISSINMILRKQLQIQVTILKNNLHYILSSIPNKYEYFL